MLLVWVFIGLLALISSKELTPTSGDNVDIFTMEVISRSMGQFTHEDGKVILYQNRLKPTDVFFTPFPRIEPMDSECHENIFSGHTELSLSVKLYTPELVVAIQTYLKHHFATLCAGNETCTVSLLPMSAIRLVQKGPRTDHARQIYTINDAWYSNTLLLQSIKFVLYMLNDSVCEQFRSAIVQQCYFSNFELHYSLHSEKTVERQLEITTEQFTETSMFNQIQSHFPNSDKVVLTGGDFKQLMSEVTDRIIIKLRIQEGFDSQLQDPINLDKLLERQLQFQQIQLKNVNDQLWDSLYWTHDLTRPDRLAKVIKTIIRKNATDTDHFIYDSHAAKNYDKRDLLQHDIDRFEQLDKFLSMHARSSSSSNFRSKYSKGKGGLNFKDFGVNAQVSGGSQSNKERSEHTQSLTDTTHHVETYNNHLNITNRESNNETQYVLSRADVENYLNELSDHVHLEGELILPKPIDAHLIKLSKLKAGTKLLSHTVLVRTRSNVHVLPLRCPLRTYMKIAASTMSLNSSLADKVDQLANQFSGMQDQVSKSISEIDQKSNNRLVEIETKWSNKLDEVNNRLTAVQDTSNSTYEQLSTRLSVFTEHNKRVVALESKLACHTTWNQHGVTVAGGNGQGNQLNQLSQPHSISIDDNQTIYITDSSNDRLIEWKSNALNGQIVAGGNGKGYRTNQLNGPGDVIMDKETNSLIICDTNNRRVIRWPLGKSTTSGEIIIENTDCYSLTMDKNGSLYISDYKQSEVRRWKKGETNGVIVAGGNGKGSGLNQLDWPTYMYVDDDYSLYVADSSNHRVMKWLKDAKQGIVVAGGNGQGNSLTQLHVPCGIVVGQLGQIYVADFLNHRVMCWCKGAREGRVVVGGNGIGAQSNQFNRSHDLLLDRQGNLYVTDHNNHRIQKFVIS